MREPLPRFAPAAPFAGLPALAEPAGGGATSARWTAGLALALALHGAAGLPFLGRAPDAPAPEAPEAAVMIDLPAEFALPPLESVAAVAAPEIAATDAPPVEAAVADAVAAETAEASAVETAEIAPEAADAVAVAAAPPPDAAETADATTVAPETTSSVAVTEATATAPVETAPVAAAEDDIPLPVEPAEAVPTEVTETAPAEPAPVEAAAAETVEAVEPAPPVLPSRKPSPPRPPRPVAEARERPAPPRKTAKPVRPKTETARAAASPAPSRAAVDGRAASGAGRPDPDAMARYLSSVRADIMRQRRSVRAAGRGKVAVVAFSIDASGALGGIALASSSGAPALDDAALAMVRRASPVPAMPAGFAAPLRTRLPVRFD